MRTDRSPSKLIRCQRAFWIGIGLAAAVATVRADQPASAGKDAPLPGLIARPASHPNIGRWQMAAKLPHGRINAIAWSPDGKRLAYAEMCYIRICDAQTFQTQAILVGHLSRITTIDWNRANDRIASSSFDGTVRLWSAAGVPENVLNGQAGEVNCVAWSPDGKQLASAGADGMVRIWGADGSPQKTIHVSDAAANCVAWSPDGKRLVTGDDDHQVKLWGSDGSAGAVCQGHIGPVSTAGWSADGKKFATSTFGFYSEETNKYVADVRIWKVDGSAVSSIADENEIYAAPWSPDGQYLAILSEVATLRLLNPAGAVASQREIPNLGGTMSSPTMSWSPDGKQIAFGGRNHVLVYDVESQQQRDSNEPPYTLPNITYADWSPDGAHIALVNIEGVDLWHPDGTFDRHVADRAFPYDTRGQIAWSPDCRQIVVIDRTGQPIVATTDGSPARPPVALPPQAARVAWNSKNGLFAYDSANTIRIAGPQSPKPQSSKPQSPKPQSSKPGDSKPDDSKADSKEVSIPLTKPLDSLFWTRDGKRLVALTVVTRKTHFALDLYDSEGKVTGSIKDVQGEVDAVDIGPDGQSVLIGLDDGHWQLWNLKEPNEPKQSVLAHLRGSCMDMSYSPDGKHFISVGWDGMTKLWNADGTPAKTLFGHTGPLYTASYSPDGRRIVTAGVDYSVRIWSAETGTADTTIFFADRTHPITVRGDGQILAGDPQRIAETFWFLLEKPSGQMEMVEYPEFLKRTGQTGK